MESEEEENSVRRNQESLVFAEGFTASAVARPLCDFGTREGKVEGNRARNGR